jgi:hypothetical protein
MPSIMKTKDPARRFCRRTAAYPNEGHPQIVAAHLREQKRKRSLVWLKKNEPALGRLACWTKVVVLTLAYSVLSPLLFGGTEPEESPSAAFCASHSSSGASTPSRSS